MDPVTLIVTALAGGAASALQDGASSAVKDAYARVKALVKQRFAGRPKAELVLAEYEAAPQTWEAPLAAELSAADAEGNADLVEAAQALMRLIDEPGSLAGKYTVSVHGGQGVQVGDHNVQQNEFGTQHVAIGPEFKGVNIAGTQHQITLHVGTGGASSASSERPEQVVQISSLLPPGTGTISDRTFENAIIVGPALVSALSGVSFEFCVFEFGGSSFEDLLWEITPRFVVGVIGLERCTFRRCRFDNIGFIGTKESLDGFRRAVRGQ